MNKLEILKRATGKIYISQTEAAILLDMTQGNISNLIKAGKIKATNTYQPKPYLDSVLEYKPKPHQKRYHRRKKKAKTTDEDKKEWAHREQDLFTERLKFKSCRKASDAGKSVRQTRP